MKKTPSRKSRRENWDDFSTGTDDLTIAPFLSSAEVCRRFGSGGDANGAKKSKKSARNAADAEDFDDETDLWNKGSEGFRAKRRAAAEAKKNRRPEKVEKIREKSGPTEKKGKSGKGAAAETPADEPKKRSKRNRNVGSEPGERGDSVGLRVVGGVFRGTKLEYGGDRRVRPMKERVREAIFNLLGKDVAGKHVIDLFAGTGALTFEAISRGAVSATAIEVHFPTARTTRQNIAILEEKMPGTAKKIELTTTDVFFWGRKLAAFDPDSPPKLSPIETTGVPNLRTDVPWLVFCSPPYDFFVDREKDVLDLIRTLRERAPSGSIFVVESDDRFDFGALDVEIPPKKRRSYPPAEVGIFWV